MKHIVPLFCLAALIGCSDAGQADEDPATEVQSPDGYASTAFEVSDEEGNSYRSYLNEDGTYFVTRNGELFQSGEWRANASGALCLTSGAENEEEACWTTAETSADGSNTYTSDTGVTLNGRPIDYDPPDLSGTAG